MSASVEELRTRLEDERERVVDVIANRRHEGSIEDEVEEHPLDNHPAEMASVTVDREIDLSLQESSEYVLAAIDAALLRIEDGTYGRCARCGQEIEAERLEAIPHATLCIECKRLEERG